LRQDHVLRCLKEAASVLIRREGKRGAGHLPPKPRGEKKKSLRLQECWEAFNLFQKGKKERRGRRCEKEKKREFTAKGRKKKGAYPAQLSAEKGRLKSGGTASWEGKKKKKSSTTSCEKRKTYRHTTTVGEKGERSLAGSVERLKAASLAVSRKARSGNRLESAPDRLCQLSPGRKKKACLGRKEGFFETRKTP